MQTRRDTYPAISFVCSLPLGGVELLLGLPWLSALLMKVRLRCRRNAESDLGSPCGTARVDVGDLSGLDIPPVARLPKRKWRKTQARFS